MLPGDHGDLGRHVVVVEKLWQQGMLSVPKLFVITIQIRLLVFSEGAVVVVDNVLLNKEHLHILFKVQIPSDDIITLSLLYRHIGMHTHAHSRKLVPP